MGVQEDRRMIKALDSSFKPFMKKFRTGPEVDAPWKWGGWTLIEKVKKYTKKHPEIITYEVSDRSHAISIIVMIPHYDPVKNWHFGTTFVHIPQVNDTPNVFFIDGNHGKGFRLAFKNLLKGKTTY